MSAHSAARSPRLSAYTPGEYVWKCQRYCYPLLSAHGWFYDEEREAWYHPDSGEEFHYETT